LKRIFFTVTNDLSYDQRMHRICTSLAGAGYAVTLVGRLLPKSIALKDEVFAQKRIRCWFNKGFLFYAEYNLRLMAFLLSQKMDAVCAIDLDTILPCLLASKWKRIVRVYDAHEYFTELKEVNTRPVVKKCWKLIERFCVTRFEHGYTVSQGLADAFKKNYNRSYAVIRNLPVLQEMLSDSKNEKLLIYQGAVNEGRAFEQLIPAMKDISYPLVICGDGNFFPQLKALIKENGVDHKVRLLGMLPPAQLRQEAAMATLGIALAEKEGLNQWMALPNKFFEYMHAGLPQIAMDYPEYRSINQQYKVAVLLPDLDVNRISRTINEVMENEELLNELRQNCLQARTVFCWQEEEKYLLRFYQKLLPLE
jgi:glycosyltransferase involved in cell wall biosynthesis